MNQTDNVTYLVVLRNRLIVVSYKFKAPRISCDGWLIKSEHCFKYDLSSSRICYLSFILLL